MRGELDVVELPAELVEQGDLPSSCTRHGRPAARRVDFALQSKTKPTGARLNVIGVADRLSEHVMSVQVTRVKHWPLCRRCVRTRTSWLAGSAGLLLGGLAAISGSLIALAFAGNRALLGLVFLLGFLAIVAAPYLFYLGSLPRLTRARTSSNGTSVEVTNPSHEFRASLN